MIPLVLRGPDGEVEVQVAIIEEAATVGDLVGAVTGRPAPAAVTVDGRRLPTATPFALAGIGRGSTVDLSGSGPDPVAATGAAVAELRQVGGPDAGGRTDRGRRG